MTTETPESVDERPYGECFLQALKALGGTLSSFNYATIQKLKKADREEMIRIFRSNSSHLPYAALQAMRKLDPEKLAERVMLERAQAAQAANQMMFAFLFLP